jgi:hypothetical protein
VAESTAGSRSTPAAYEGGRGAGLVAFAAVLLTLVGFLNVLDGIAAIARSHVFIGNAHYVFGNLRAWGWVVLIIGILVLCAAAGIAVGNQWARWFGVVMIGLNALAQMVFLPAYPFWSLTIIAIDVVALYGLCVYGGRRPAHR